MEINSLIKILKEKLIKEIKINNIKTLNLIRYWLSDPCIMLSYRMCWYTKIICKLRQI